MKEVPLTQGYFALVDDGDYERVMQHKWYAKKHHGGGMYAGRSTYPNGRGKPKPLMLHTFILGYAGLIDHRDRNGLNNQRHNLRPCTTSQNCANSGKQRGIFTSRWRGVEWSKRSRKWIAKINCNGKRKYLGYFKQEYNAALAYNFAAEELFGEFASYNLPANPPG